MRIICIMFWRQFIGYYLFNLCKYLGLFITSNLYRDTNLGQQHIHVKIFIQLCVHPLGGIHNNLVLQQSQNSKLNHEWLSRTYMRTKFHPKWM